MERLLLYFVVGITLFAIGATVYNKIKEKDKDIYIGGKKKDEDTWWDDYEAGM